MERPLRIRLHVLSPLHIGCDEVYEPTSFVIDERRGKLITFDPLDFVMALTPVEKDQFSRTCASDNLLGVFKDVRRFYKPSIPGRELSVSTGLVAHYNRILTMSTYDKKAVIHQFTISRTAFNHQGNLPYIPGSSLKGSLRTAYLSALAAVKGTKDWWEHSETRERDRARGLEEYLLGGSFETDPLRMIKVSDLLPEGEVKTKVVYAVNKRKKPSERATLAESGPTHVLETIQAASTFIGTMNIETPQPGTGIRVHARQEELLLAAHKFFAGVLKNEIGPMNALGLRHTAGQLANAEFKDKFKTSAFLIRIGRHSGAEAVTIEGNRYIRIMQGRDRPAKFSKEGATTFWLASEEPKPAGNAGLVPFGWAVLELLGGHREA